MKRHISTYPSPPAIELLRQPEVVIIDDDVELTRAIARVLKNKYNCRVWGFSSVEEFLDVLDGKQTAPLKENDLDLILLDFHLPGRNGPRLVEELHRRSSLLLSRARIMGITADGEAQVINSFKDAGIDDVLRKPLRKFDFGRIAEQAYKICSGDMREEKTNPKIIKTYI
jgi:CheY-like chemotaxis protein